MKLLQALLVPITILQVVTGVSAIGAHRVVSLRSGPRSDGTYDEGTNGPNGWGMFDQLLDHSNPHLGTFKQRYWYGTQFWKGPGSPIFFSTPGEDAAESYNTSFSTTMGLQGLFANETGGAIVALQHRYWGESSPFDSLTVEDLQYLTLENAIKDLTYFANNWVPPFDSNGTSSPKRAPWIINGASYAGALAVYTADKDPGTFWGYVGSSATVETISNFYEYFIPILEATPKNCSTDINAVIDYVDNTLLHGTQKEKQALKDRFMLGNLEDADFAGALENGPWTWQANQFNSFQTGGNSYYAFCDYIEGVWPNSTNKVPGPEGVGLVKALDHYAKYFKEIDLPFSCEGYGYSEFQGENNTLCYQALNASNPMYQDIRVDNPYNRQWMWMLCNQPLEFWQTGAPRGQTTLVSRLVTAEYGRAQCSLLFKDHYGLAEGKTAASVDKYTGGWATPKAKRMLLVNGQYDPWRFATVASDFRPGGPLQSTPELPTFVVPGGFHGSDRSGANWAVNPELQAIVDQEVVIVKKWVADFNKGCRRSS